jgi:hypothetical protein
MLSIFFALSGVSFYDGLMSSWKTVYCTYRHLEARWKILDKLDASSVELLEYKSPSLILEDIIRPPFQGRSNDLPACQPGRNGTVTPGISAENCCMLARTPRDIRSGHETWPGTYPALFISKRPNTHIRQGKPVELPAKSLDCSAQRKHTSVTLLDWSG